MGLVIILALGLYLAIAMGVIAWAVSYAKKNGKSAKRWGWGAALGMYLLVFWDWIPTVVAHKYYCATEAGFWVYKTPEQWKQENPGVMEGLVSYNKNLGGFNVDWPSQYEQHNEGRKKINTNHINERFNEIVSQQDISGILPIVREENVLLDIKKNDVIARYVDFGTGNSAKNTVGPPGPLKFWLRSADCIDGREKQIKFGNFYLQFKGTEK
jgi:hypothetical protein